MGNTGTYNTIFYTKCCKKPMDMFDALFCDECPFCNYTKKDANFRIELISEEEYEQWKINEFLK